MAFKRGSSALARPLLALILSVSAATAAGTSSTTTFSSISSEATTLHTTTHNSTSVTKLSDLPSLPSTSPIPSSLASSIPSTIPASNGNYASEPGSSGSTTDQHSNLVNLYFFFLLILGVIGAAAVWLLYRRRRRKALAMSTSRRDALERDLSDSAGARGGLFGPIDGERWRERRRWLSGFTSSSAARGPVNIVEGLNEAGHAPPPYKARSTDTIIPVDTANESKPPDYHEVEVAEATSDESSVGEGSSTRRTSHETRQGTG